MSGNVWHRPSGSFMVDIGISSNIMKSPSPKMLHDILGHGHLQWHPKLIRYYTNFWTYHRTGPYYQFWPYNHISGGFHRTLQRVRLANRGRLLLRTPGPVPFGTCIFPKVETILSWTFHVYGPFEFRTSLGTSILLRTSVCCSIIHFIQQSNTSILASGIMSNPNVFLLRHFQYVWPHIHSIPKCAYGSKVLIQSDFKKDISIWGKVTILYWNIELLCTCHYCVSRLELPWLVGRLVVV